MREYKTLAPNRSRLRRVADYLRHQFFGCGGALCHCAAVISGTVVGLELASLYFPSRVGYILLVLGMYSAMELAFFLLQTLFRWWLGKPLAWLMAIATTAVSTCTAVQYGAGEGWTWRVLLTGGVFTIVVLLLTASLWSITKRGWRWGTGSCATVSVVLSIAMVLLLTMDGFADQSIQDYLALTAEEENRVEALNPSYALGSHAVSVLDYGPDEALEANTVSLASYMARNDDFTGLYVDNYLDYDIHAVPLRGRVWYPSDGQNCPVLFIAHGNHAITTPSYQGYAYLGEYLASHGYVVVSVDQNACNMLSGENDARAVLLLEHIGLLLSYNEEQGNPLYSVLDADNIAIAGHSRGGEMIATAYLFNDYSHYPENAVVRFDYHYNIKSLIAIAPTVNQYKPADHSVAIADVNYLLLHGASDRDVTNFMGMSQYENVTFTGAGDYIKSALYIAGANHGQFNSLWGAYDSPGVEMPLLNTKNLLSEEEQQTIACLFVKVFLDVTLRGDESCRTLLTDWEDYAAQLPETVYVQCHEESGFTAIADFEEDSEIATATLEGARIQVKGVNWWTEELMDFAGRSAYDTHALRLRWIEQATLTLSVPVMDVTDMALTFDICDLDVSAVEEGAYDLLDATVVLTDTNGHSATAQLRDHAVVYPVLLVKTDKLDFVFDTPSVKEAFATVSIPVTAFVCEDDAVNLSRIRQIQLQFDGGGQVALDNIGVTPA